MNTGLVDACVLGRLLTAVVSLKQPDAILDQYQSLRRPAAEKVLALAGRLTRMATVRNPAARQVRNLLFSVVDHLPFAKHALAIALSGLSRRQYAEVPAMAPGDFAAQGRCLRFRLLFTSIRCRLHHLLETPEKRGGWVASSEQGSGVLLASDPRNLTTEPSAAQRYQSAGITAIGSIALSTGLSRRVERAQVLSMFLQSLTRYGSAARSGPRPAGQDQFSPNQSPSVTH